MPRLAGVNVLGGFLAGLAIYFVGFLWFAMLFDQLWMEANGYSEATIVENFDAVAFFGGGFLVPIVLGFTLGWLLKKTGTSGLVPSMVFALKLSLFIAAPLLAYGYIYNEIHSLTALALDVSHSVVGFVLAGAVLSFFE